MIKVHRINVQPAQLRKLTSDERVLVLLLGYVSNQVSMLQKLLVFAVKLEPTELTEVHGTGAQTQMLIRLAVGAVHEAWRLITTRFLQNKVSKDYINLIDESGIKALDELKKQFGSSSLLSHVRNRYGFHYPDNPDVERLFESAANDPGSADIWRLYASEHGFNSLFMFSESIYIYGIIELSDSNDLAGAQHQLMKELSVASINTIEFARSLFAAIWVRNFGNEIEAQEVIEICDAPDAANVPLPFFVKISQPIDFM